MGNWIQMPLREVLGSAIFLVIGLAVVVAIMRKPKRGEWKMSVYLIASRFRQEFLS